MRVTTHAPELYKIFKTARVAKNYTQKDLAKKIGARDVQLISNWERGNSTPSATYLNRLTKVLGVKSSTVRAILLKSYSRQLAATIN